MDDDKLIEEIRQGNEEAASSLVEKYWERMFRYLYRLCCHSHDAEELAQQTFLQIFEHLDRYTTGTNFSAWIYRVATNLFLDHKRKSKRRDDVVQGGVMIASPSGEPAETVQGKELSAAIEQAIMNLPEDQCIVLTLRVNEDLSHREIAEIVDSEENTVRWRLHRARRRLLEMLDPYL